MIYLVILLMLPIMEIAVFIKTGQSIGVANTLLLTAATAIIGAIMLRVQGLSTLTRAREKLSRDEAPTAEIFDSLCLFGGAFLLLLPGFITDAAGVLLFLPPVRATLRANMSEMPVFFTSSNGGPSGRKNPYSGAGERPRDPTVIEGEYREIDENDAPKK